eukprot:GHVT01020989.1.p1 GENE.GHVT01020989.1~~GHVT01020989.1.p1  ORF type:complete len:510 (-),score=65.09 GHVT01020989.1:393-1922(-)
MPIPISKTFLRSRSAGRAKVFSVDKEPGDICDFRHPKSSLALGPVVAAWAVVLLAAAALAVPRSATDKTFLTVGPRQRAAELPQPLVPRLLPAVEPPAFPLPRAAQAPPALAESSPLPPTLLAQLSRAQIRECLELEPATGWAQGVLASKLGRRLGRKPKRKPKLQKPTAAQIIQCKMVWVTSRALSNLLKVPRVLNYFNPLLYVLPLISMVGGAEKDCNGHLVKMYPMKDIFYKVIRFNDSGVYNLDSSPTKENGYREAFQYFTCEVPEVAVHNLTCRSQFGDLSSFTYEKGDYVVVREAFSSLPTSNPDCSSTTEPISLIATHAVGLTKEMGEDLLNEKNTTDVTEMLTSLFCDNVQGIPDCPETTTPLLDTLAKTTQKLSSVAAERLSWTEEASSVAAEHISSNIPQTKASSPIMNAVANFVTSASDSNTSPSAVNGSYPNYDANDTSNALANNNTYLPTGAPEGGGKALTVVLALGITLALLAVILYFFRNLLPGGRERQKKAFF